MRVSHLIRHRSGSLYFRYVFPSHLRPLLGREVRISLGLALKSEALPIAFHLSLKTSQIVAQVMSKKVLSIPESRLRVWVRDMLKEEMRKEYQAHCSRRIPLSSASLESRLSDIVGIQEECSVSLVKGGYFPAEDSSRALLREHGIDSDAIESNVPMCARVIMQEHDKYAAFMKRLYSDPLCSEREIDDLYADENVAHVNLSSTIPVSAPTCVDSSVSIGDAVRRYIDYKMGRKDWNQKSSVTNPIILKRFGDVRYSGRCVKDISVHEMNLEIMSTYVSHIYGRGLSGKTIQNNFVVVKTFVKWCEEEGYVENADKLNKRLRLSSRDKTAIKEKKRTAFSNEDISKLFNSPQYLENRFKLSWQFWIPLIGLLSGARIEEIAQLCVADIKKIDRIWCFDINGEGEKSVKSVASKRLVPIHPLLLDIGLIDRVDMLAEKGCVELFPTIERSSVTGKKGDLVSKWFTRYRRKCGVADKDSTGLSKSFHSFRHTVVTLLRAHDVDEKFVTAVVGHKSSRSVTDIYDANVISMDLLLEKAISKLTFECLPIDVLKNSRAKVLP